MEGEREEKEEGGRREEEESREGEGTKEMISQR